jgi:hypothetical protein
MHNLLSQSKTTTWLKPKKGKNQHEMRANKGKTNMTMRLYHLFHSYYRFLPHYCHYMNAISI